VLCGEWSGVGRGRSRNPPVGRAYPVFIDRIESV
jgi:hypothetical protein